MMKQVTLTVIAGFFVLTAAAATASGCATCRGQVQSGIYGKDFAQNFLLLLLPVIFIVAVGIALYFADGMKKEKHR